MDVLRRIRAAAPRLLAAFCPAETREGEIQSRTPALDRREEKPEVAPHRCRAPFLRTSVRLPGQAPAWVQRSSSDCPPSVGLNGAPHVPPDLPGQGRREPGGVCTRSAFSLHPGEGRLASPTRTPASGARRLLAALVSLPHRRPRRRPTPPLPGPRASPPPTRHPAPGSRRPACAPGALMSSRDSPCRLTWCCLARISRQDLLGSRGSIRQARPALPALAPQGGAECGDRR